MNKNSCSLKGISFSDRPIALFIAFEFRVQPKEHRQCWPHQVLLGVRFTKSLLGCKGMQRIVCPVPYVQCTRVEATVPQSSKQHRLFASFFLDVWETNDKVCWTAKDKHKHIARVFNKTTNSKQPHQIPSSPLPDLALTAQHDVHLDGDFVERTDGHT